MLNEFMVSLGVMKTFKNQTNEDGFMPCGYIKNHRIVYLCNESLFVLPAPVT